MNIDEWRVSNVRMKLKLGGRLAKMFAKYGAEIAHTGKAAKLAHLGNRISARLQQFHRVAQPDGLDKIGR